MSLFYAFKVGTFLVKSNRRIKPNAGRTRPKEDVGRHATFGIEYTPVYVHTRNHGLTQITLYNVKKWKLLAFSLYIHTCISSSVLFMDAVERAFEFN